MPDSFVERVDKTVEDIDDNPAGQESGIDDPDAEFGGTEARKRMEHRLVRKLDLRMCILIIIYILNYVGDCLLIPACANI